MTAIKMCGITRREDAALAVTLGVHALGFVFWPKSPRAISVANASGIIRGLPPFVTPVGVFVNPTTEEVVFAAEAAGIRVAQIHGDVPAWLGGIAPVTILRAVHLAAGDAGDIEPAVGGVAPVLLDAHDPVRHGGTGQRVDWQRAQVVAGSRPVVLAGGLTPVNVAEAIAIVQPYAVDVASGIESRPGVKDHLLMRQFADAVSVMRPASFLRKS